jgi:hypothetical protein
MKLIAKRTNYKLFILSFNNPVRRKVISISLISPRIALIKSLKFASIGDKFLPKTKAS